MAAIDVNVNAAFDVSVPFNETTRTQFIEVSLKFLNYLIDKLKTQTRSLPSS